MTLPTTAGPTAYSPNSPVHLIRSKKVKERRKLKPATADGSPLRRVRRYLRRRRRRTALLPASRHRACLLRTTSPEAAAVGISTVPPSTSVLPSAAPARRSAAAGISGQRQVRLQEGACHPSCIPSTRGLRIAPSFAGNSSG